MTRNLLSRSIPFMAAAAVSALALAGCADDSSGGQQSSTPSSGGDSADTYRVAFVPGISSDPFFAAMELAAQDEATSLGIDLQYQGSSSDYSPQAQLPFIENAIADGVDGLIVAATDPTAIQASLDKAAAAGIVVATVDTTVDNQDNLVTHITGDNTDGGEKAADAMADMIGGSGKVFVVSGSPTITTDTLRVEGFQNRVAEAYPDIEIVGVDYAYSQPSEATTKTSSALLNNPDLKGVFSAEGNAGVGAVAALRDAGRVGDVVLIGYDAYPNQVDELKEGIYTALVAQNPAEEARLALQAVVAALKGDSSGIEKNVVVPNVVMTADNLDETAQYEYVQ